MRRMNRTRGFTLIELMVTMVVAALLLAWAVPNFEKFIKKTTLTSETNNWVGVINYARNEAITRGKRVTVCRTASANTCNGTADCKCGVSQAAPADGIPNYHSGYLIFTSSGNSQPINFLAASDQLIRVGKAETSRVTIRGNVQGNNDFSFLPSGTLDPNDVSSTGLTARYVVCIAGSSSDLSAAQNAEKSDGRAVVISQTGRATVEELASTHCSGTAADSLPN